MGLKQAATGLRFLFAWGFSFWPGSPWIAHSCRTRLLPFLGLLPALILLLRLHRTLLAQGLFALAALLLLLAGQLHLLTLLLALELRSLGLLHRIALSRSACIRRQGGCAAIPWSLLAQWLILPALLLLLCLLPLSLLSLFPHHTLLAQGFFTLPALLLLGLLPHQLLLPLRLLTQQALLVLLADQLRWLSLLFAPDPLFGLGRAALWCRNW
jgi:hypothetical protein